MSVADNNNPTGGTSSSSNAVFDAKLFEGLELVSAAYSGQAKRYEAIAASLRREVSQLTDERATLRARESSLSAQLSAAVERNDALEREQRRLLNENAQLVAQVRQFEARTAKLENFKRAIMSSFDVDEQDHAALFGSTGGGGGGGGGGSQQQSQPEVLHSSTLSHLRNNKNVVSSLPRQTAATSATAAGRRSAFASSYLPAQSLMSTLKPEDLDGPRRANGTIHHHDDDNDDDNDDTDNDSAVAQIVDEFIAYARSNIGLEEFKALLELIEARQQNQLDDNDVLAKARVICQSHPETLQRFTAVVDAMRNL